jgi:hypothetical protein
MPEVVDLRRARTSRDVLRHPVLTLAGRREYVWGRHEDGPGYWTAPAPKLPEPLDMSAEACAERIVQRFAHVGQTWGATQ